MDRRITFRHKGYQSRFIVLKCIRFLVFTLLVVLVLGAGAYLLRWPLFGGLIRSATAKAFSGVLGGTVEIEGLSGSLFTLRWL